MGRCKYKKRVVPLEVQQKNDIKVPEKSIPKCTRFIYCGAKLFSTLPSNIKKSLDTNLYKTLIKLDRIWKNIPSY